MSDLRYQTCCFIGQRDVPAYEAQKILTRIRYILRPLTNGVGGLKYFGVGGGLGFDMFVAEYLLECRDEHAQRIKIISVLPYPDWRERENWPDDEGLRQEWIMRRSDKVTYVCDAYRKDAYQLRDRKLIDESGYCISYCNRLKGETADSLRYAMSRGKYIYNASSWDLEQLRMKR